MVEEIICLDSSVLIDFYRKKDKTKSYFYNLTTRYNVFAVSVLTEYEKLIGSKEDKEIFWEPFFNTVEVLPFDKAVNIIAIQVFKQLKTASKLIEIPDILIGSTAIAHGYKLATLNRKHFERIAGLSLVDLDFK
ncbi:type II toxin-antitoxin system VapC family toxin [Dyadobacter sp. CY323]|uniref:type II toxin-antitoxin system VapC family toxin n=1 Tax=Dyadobacter sp. CY323 TaxID=2907302 RepID=UPI001F37E396|nr:type II toxin-antitoxin system VapC family toxin [Dyadobacter sp. CY323]MCE6990359.1 type II toxin-antitoxin system VapC family toxin [Dyadobacter sp. CY323]